MMTMNLQALAQSSSERMLNSVIEGVGLALFAWIVLRLAKRHNSSTRFAVWYAVLVAIAALPILGSAFSGGALPGSRAQITIPVSWAFYFLVPWAVIAFIGLVRIGIGLWQVRRLRRTAVPVDSDAVNVMLQKAAENFPTARRVNICESDGVRVPTAIGFFRPMVLIPSWAVRELPSTELTAVVLHELAHLRRWDDWTNLLQKIVGAILFFHPAIWWIRSHLSLEREMACDDLVVGATDNRRAYAQCLISMAEKSFLRRGLAMAQAAVGRMRHTSLRVSQILDTRHSGVTRVWKPSLVAVAAGTLATFAALPHIPRLVAFGGEPTEIARKSMPTQDAERNQNRAFIIQASAHQDLLTAARSAGTTSVASTTLEGHGFSRAAHRADGRALAPEVRAKSDRTPTPVQAKVMARTSKPMVVRASLRPTEEVKPPDVFFVVMRSQQYGASGATLWSISVYRLTAFHPSKQQIQNETPAKKT
jgi:beta-lactamase regulating signal transducer with metallopeptidase domain